MKMSFARDPRIMAALGTLALTVLIAMGLRAGSLPFINPPRTTYSAEFSDAGGLKPGDPVEVAGIVVGQVEALNIRTDRVAVVMKVDQDVQLGNRSRAAVKVGTLLGAKYLDLTPVGASRLPGDSTIPLARTTPAYDLVAAFADLTEVEKKLDVDTIATALDTLSSTFQDTPEQVKASLRGLADFSNTIATRDQEVASLIHHTAETSQVLDQRKRDISRLIEATNLVLDELEQRKKVVHRLLVNTADLAQQLQGLVRDNEKAITPALARLADVTRMLENHQADLRELVRRVTAYGTTFNNVVGTGPWFDVLIPRLPDSVTVTEQR